MATERENPVPNDTYAAPDDERDELELEVERARDSFHDSIHRAESQGKDLVKNAFTAAKPTLIAAAAVTGVVVIGIVIFRLMKPKPLRITIPGVTMAPAGRPAATLLRTVVTQVATLAARQIAQRLLQDLSRPPRRLTSGEAFR
jgi:predicted PurR-regulated permease PerM